MAFPYSPILPPIINTNLLMLAREVLSGPQRTEFDQKAWDEHRSLSLSLLQHHFESATHDRALEIIKDAWSNRTPFGVYLRNFGLGTVLSEPFSDSDSFNHEEEILTFVSMVDFNLQLEIEKHIINETPIIGVENPAYDQRQKDGLPKLILDNASWLDVVKGLVTAAAIILIFYDEPSPGLDSEIQLMRDLDRQSSTIVIRPTGQTLQSIRGDKRLREDVFSSLPGAKVEQAVPRSFGGKLMDFPNQLPWDQSVVAIRRLKEAITGILLLRNQANFDVDCPQPARPEPADDVKLWGQTSIGAHELLAKQAVRDGNLVNAEDHITWCLAVSFFCDDSDVRAIAFVYLAYVQWFHGELTYAIDNLERSLDILSRLPPRDYSMLAEFVQMLQPYRNEDRVESLLRRIDNLQSDLI